MFKPTLTVEKTQAVYEDSTVTYSSSTVTYSSSSVNYGGSDRRQDEGPDFSIEKDFMPKVDMIDRK